MVMLESGIATGRRSKKCIRILNKMTEPQVDILKRLIMNQPVIEPDQSDLEVLEELGYIVQPVGITRYYGLTLAGREALIRWVNDQIPPLPAGSPSYGGRA